MKYLIDAIESNSNSPFMVFEERTYTYQDLFESILNYRKKIPNCILRGSVVAIQADYSFNCVALFYALALNRSIIIPLSIDSKQKHNDYIHIGQAQHVVQLDKQGLLDCSKIETEGNQNEFYNQLRSYDHAGLVLFSSGSSGPPKGIVHDLRKLADAYKKPGKAWRTLIFLQIDHIGGINTLFYNVRNNGTIVVPRSRMPDEICQCIEQYQVELLPTSPTFLNLMIISDAISRYDLSSLKMITYGTEPMAESTLKRIHELLPNVRFKQTYGLSETGILNTKSRDDGSLWVKIGGPGFDIKIVENKLWIRSDFSMLGYLNADCAFEKSGFFNTGDVVEQDGEWLKILGRESELINVGGNKVFPAEVESVLQKMPEVEDVLIHGIPNPLTGQMVAAVVKTREKMEVGEFKNRMRLFCKPFLEPYKIPIKIVISDEGLHSERFKKNRKAVSEKFS